MSLSMWAPVGCPTNSAESLHVYGLQVTRTRAWHVSFSMPTASNLQWQDSSLHCLVTAADYQLAGKAAR